MTETAARRRGHGEDAICFDATKNRYVGAVSLGFGPDAKRNRRKMTGRTKQSANGPELFPSLEVREVKARVRHLAKILAPALPSMWPGAMIDLWQAASASRGTGAGRITWIQGSASGVAGLLAELSRWPECGCGMLAIERFQAAVVPVANGGVRCPRERAVMPGRGQGAATGVIAVPGAR